MSWLEYLKYLVMFGVALVLLGAFIWATYDSLLDSRVSHDVEREEKLKKIHPHR